MFKLNSAITVITVSGMLIASKPADTFQLENRYQLKSFIAEYDITGTNQTGTEKLYVDNFGAVESRITELDVSFMGIKSSSNTMMLMEGEWSYTIDLKTNTGTKLNIAEASDLMMGSKQHSAFRDFRENTIKAFNGEKIGTESILGKPCEIIDFPKLGSRVWLYKGVPLKNQANIAGMEVTYTATFFQENAVIPKDRISLPANAKITDTVNLAEIKKEMKAMPDVDYDAAELAAQMEEAKKTMDNADPRAKAAMDMLQNLLGSE